MVTNHLSEPPVVVIISDKRRSTVIQKYVSFRDWGFWVLEVVHFLNAQLILTSVFVVLNLLCGRNSSNFAPLYRADYIRFIEKHM